MVFPLLSCLSLPWNDVTMGCRKNPWNEQDRGSRSLHLTGSSYHKECTYPYSHACFLNHSHEKSFSGTELLCWRRGSITSSEVENHCGEDKESGQGCSPIWTILSKFPSILSSNCSSPKWKGWPKKFIWGSKFYNLYNQHRMTGLWLELNVFGLICSLAFLTSHFRTETYMCENSHWPQAQIQSLSKFLASKSRLKSLATQRNRWQ